MLELLIFIAVAALFVEGLTELICKSIIFLPAREKLSEANGFIAKMLRCGYCTSVWVSMLPALFISFCTDISSFWVAKILYFLLYLVIVHRLSNYIHNFNDKFLDKYYDNRFRGSGEL